MRKLARSTIVNEVSPIIGADNLELARIGGWYCVVGKGDFTPGCLAVYFEIDSFLPASDVRWSSFCARSTQTLETDKGPVSGHRVRTIKLRGCLSQGLLLTFKSLGLPESPAETDLTEALGVLKWEVSVAGPSIVPGNQSVPFPVNLVPKTDAERVQNINPLLLDSLEVEDWVATEKVDGTSLTVIRHRNNELTVCSRNWVIDEGDDTYWWGARQIAEFIPPGFAVQAEIYGPGIQGNPLNLTERRMSVFLVSGLDCGYTPVSDWPEGLIKFGVPQLQLTLPYDRSCAAFVAQVDGLKSVIAPSRLAEGVVWRHRQGRTFHAFGGRPVFKVISNKYLLKQG